MKAHLLYRDRDFDWRWALQAAAEREAKRTGRRPNRPQDFDPRSGLPWNTESLTADLALTALIDAMGRDDDCIQEVSRKVVLAGVSGDIDNIRYRQHVLADCTEHPAIVRDVYAVAVEAMAKQRAHYIGILARYPDSVLRHSIETMTTFLVYLKKLREIADLHAYRFVSEGWTEFFAMLQRDLDDNYLALVQDHLDELQFRHGELLGAELGKANKGSRYVLHRTPWRRRSWRQWLTGLFAERPPGYTFELHPRDEAGTKALSDLRNRGISLAADALGQAADHVGDFFGALRAELAFYVGCLNLHERLHAKGEPTCMPSAAPAEEQRLSFRGLYDVSLALTVDRRVVGNDADADGKGLVVVTGANTGGKSTFLRSIGLAQLMMQSGMFVPATSFSANLCAGLFTHYKREEDVSLQSGKLDEELHRMSEIIDHIAPRSLLLSNESFSSTNEREGSEIARQVFSALLAQTVRVVCVTHLYELAHGFYENLRNDALFLRAGRNADGTRTFRLQEGEPLPTSYGADLYNRIFQRSVAREAASRT